MIDRGETMINYSELRWTEWRNFGFNLRKLESFEGEGGGKSFVDEKQFVCIFQFDFFWDIRRISINQSQQKQMISIKILKSSSLSSY